MVTHWSKNSPAIFLEIMDSMLTVVEGAAEFLDDISIVGQSK